MAENPGRAKRSPGRSRWGIVGLLVPGILVLITAGGLAAEPQNEKARAALKKELADSRHFQEKTLLEFDRGDREEIKKGKVVAILQDIPGSPVKIGKGVGVIDEPPAVVMQVITDLNNYKTFMPFTKESEVDLKRSGGDVIYFYSKLKVPLVDDRFYTLKMTSEENVDGLSGSFFISWSLDPEKEANLYLNSGSWKLVPYGPDGNKTLAFYTVITDPGGNIPNFIKNKSTKVGVPSVFEAITKRAREGMKSGLYHPPLPVDKMDRLLSEKVRQTRGLDISFLETLSEKDRKELEEGEILLSMKDVEGTWVKMGQAVAIFPVPTEKMWTLITAFDEYKEYIPYVEESTVDAEKSRGNVTYLYERLHFVVFPFIKDRYFSVKLSEEENVGGKAGTYFLQWKLNPAVEANVNENCGSWKLVPYGDKGEQTLLFYTILADPGGLSPWFWKNLSARKAGRKVLTAIGERAQQ